MTIKLSAFLAIFHDTHSTVLDDIFQGDDEALIEAFGFADGDFEPDALEAAFLEAEIEESEEWPQTFWDQLSTALEEEDV